MTKESKSKSAEPAPPARWLQITSSVLSVATLLAVIACIVVGHRELRSRAAALRSRPVHVRFAWPALASDPSQSWLDPRSRATLEGLALANLTDDPFDVHALANAQQALMSTGWFASPVHLSRSTDNTVTVIGQWRPPVAAVRFDGMDRLVAPGGVLLPLRYQPDGSGMKLIQGVQSPLPDQGEPWIGGEVQAGLSLLEFLRDMPGANQIYAIDTSEYLTQRRLTLITTRGGRIVWGGEPGAYHPGQAPASAKRDRLAGFYRDFGSIDTGRTLLDVRSESGAYIVDATMPPPTAPAPPGRKSRQAALATPGRGRP